jgi:hypothetical protein
MRLFVILMGSLAVLWQADAQLYQGKYLRLLDKKATELKYELNYKVERAVDRITSP